MYADDHNPPHFHAQYQGREVMVAIADGAILEGEMPRQLIRHLQEWRAIHEDELMSNWRMLSSGEGQPNRIEPLA